ncbi:MAG TPA: hypothetical protein VKL40_02035 [Candidatus Angelobacter sp.]|nr:hypothetical protein [Candidatus Angelobacter sp.]
MRIASSVLFLLACLCAAQSPSAPGSPTSASRGGVGEPQATAAPGPAKMENVSTLVQQQFGPRFTIPTKFPTVLIVADFDGDGVEDVAIVADSRDPLSDSYDYKYTVSDPYYSFFGYGNPTNTVTFGRADPNHSHDLLIIFGAGADAWHAATPKAKFVVINVPFDEINVGRMLIKKGKPPIYVIKAMETRSMEDSAVFWDAKKKKWKWQPA